MLGSFRKKTKCCFYYGEENKENEGGHEHEEEERCIENVLTSFSISFPFRISPYVYMPLLRKDPIKVENAIRFKVDGSIVFFELLYRSDRHNPEPFASPFYTFYLNR